MVTFKMQALYSKYRPETFKTMIGQKPIIETLSNQIKNDRIGHAYMFSGQRGTGKTTAARILARAACCTSDDEDKPCGVCESCKMLMDGTSDDIVEVDAASNNGVDDIRSLLDKCSYAPIHGKKRVYILDEVHMLSASAFNALLKMLEEPPEHMIFILATTEPRKVPMTIMSRCQKYSFCPVREDELFSMLKMICEKEGFEFEEESLKHIAKICNGSVRDAISLLDQCASYNNNVTLQRVTDLSGEPEQEDIRKTLSAMKTGNVGVAIDTVRDMWYQGKAPIVVAETLYHAMLIEVINGTGSTGPLQIMAELITQLTRQKSQVMTLFETAIARICVGDKPSVFESAKEDEEPEEPVDLSQFRVLQYKCNPYGLTMAFY